MYFCYTIEDKDKKIVIHCIDFYRDLEKFII